MLSIPRKTSSIIKNFQKPKASTMTSRISSVLMSVSCLLFLSGCLSPLALERAVMQYDEKVHQVEANMLLLNIARASQNIPIHFTTVPNIAATFDFRTNAGFGGQFFDNATVGADQANLYNFNIGGSMAENPTIFITPVQGEEYITRMLTPMNESKFEFLVHQGVGPSVVFRMMARAIVIEEQGKRIWFQNAPLQDESYKEFRRRILHLAALDQIGALDVGYLNFDEPWPMPADKRIAPKEISVAFESGYQWVSHSTMANPILSKDVMGRLLIANYNPAVLSNEERKALNRKAQTFPRNFILVDIRPGSPGGDYPFQGWIKLRSFKAVLEFLGRGISQEPEFFVDKDPRTEGVIQNPAKTLEIVESDHEPDKVAFTINFNGHVYSIGTDSRWNLKAFEVLSQLFQMTVIDVAQVPKPSITIAK